MFSFYLLFICVLLFIALLSVMVTLAPLVRRKIHDVFKGAGEMKLVGITYLTGDFCNREICRSQVFAGLVDTVGDQKLLRAFSRHFFEKLAEITAIESQMLSDILNGDIFPVGRNPVIIAFPYQLIKPVVIFDLPPLLP